MCVRNALSVDGLKICAPPNNVLFFFDAGHCDTALGYAACRARYANHVMFNGHLSHIVSNPAPALARTASCRKMRYGHRVRLLYGQKELDDIIRSVNSDRERIVQCSAAPRRAPHGHICPGGQH